MVLLHSLMNPVMTSNSGTTALSILILRISIKSYGLPQCQCVTQIILFVIEYMVPLTLICFITNLSTPQQSQMSKVGSWMVKISLSRQREQKTSELANFYCILKEQQHNKRSFSYDHWVGHWDRTPMCKLQQKIIAFYNHHSGII